MASLNAFDIAVAIVIVVSAIMAYARGFVHSFLWVAAWVGAIFATFYGFGPIRPFAHEVIPVPLAADITAGVAIFVVSLVLLSLVSQALGKMVQDSPLNMVDRSLGFLFGILRGVVIVCLFYLVAERFAPPEGQPSWLRSARTSPLIETGVRLMKSLVPDEAVAAGNGAARKAGEQTRKALGAETKSAFDQILAPEPKAGAPEPRAGYNEQERREIDRLIDSAQ